MATKKDSNASVEQTALILNRIAELAHVVMECGARLVEGACVFRSNVTTDFGHRDR